MQKTEFILNQFNIVVEKNLFPLVPIFNHSNRPIVPWSNKDNLIKNLEEIKVQKITFNYKNKQEENKQGTITGLAIVTGIKSNIIVIDLDRNHGRKNIDGIKNFKEIVDTLEEKEEIKHQILNTFSVKTPNGGLHLYFKYKEGLRTGANAELGIDLRSDGGIIVAPGTMRKIKDSEDNEVIREYKVYRNSEIVEMPQSLYEEIHKYFGAENKILKKNVTAVNSNSTVEKYFNTKLDGERNNAMISFLGMLITQPKFREYNMLYKMADMYNKVYMERPLEDKVLHEKVNSALSYAKPSYCDERGKVIEWRLVNYILENIPMYKRGNILYMYNEEHNIYETPELEDIKKLFFQYAVEDTDKKSTKAKSFLETLIMECERENYTHDSKYYINCMNGIIDINTDKLTNYDSKYKLEVQFRGRYMSLEEYEDKFMKSKFKILLEDILDHESIITLQEAWGTMISPHSEEVQKCFIYLGEGSNGKSTLFSIQQALIGDREKICGIGLGQFGEQFHMSMAEGKVVNIVVDDDLSDNKKVNGVFKSIVCGEPITVNRKNKDLQRMQFNMAMFFGLNRMPQAIDKSDGFFRRLTIIPFNTTFGTEEEVDKGLRDKVKIPGISNEIINNEMDLVFMWAYQGLQRLKSNSWIITENGASNKEKEEYRQEADSAYAFFKINIEKSKERDIKASVVYQNYTNWCLEEGIRPMNGTQFGKQLKSVGIKKTRKSDGIYYLDIKFKNKKNPLNNINLKD